jgi:hypothetical protein
MMTTNDMYLPSVTTSGMKVKKERNNSMDTIGIKLEEGGITKHTCDMKVKV